MKFLCKYLGHKYVKLWDFDIIDWVQEDPITEDYYNLYCRRCKLFDDKKYY